jgi:hypothetical protein
MGRIISPQPYKGNIMNEKKVVVLASLTVSEPELISEGLYKVNLTHPLLAGELSLTGAETTISAVLSIIENKEPKTSPSSIETVIGSLLELADLSKAIKKGG